MHQSVPWKEEQSLSVSALALHLQDTLKRDAFLQDVWVHGEVSNCKAYPSGHCYFTLKEGEAQLHCVFFKAFRVRMKDTVLRDGMSLAAHGRIAYYERDGKLQLYIRKVRLRGEGILFQQFEQLKACLMAEGLFDPERKRPLPACPSVVGIVTSPQAAALRDMLRVLRVRYPLAQVLLSPAIVQGSEAPSSIAAAIDLLNEDGIAEVMIVGRGGGSIEDLWAFNDEMVVRAIARSSIPVISGVGHETDFTIADFVADHRASTPTAAATIAVPNREDRYLDLANKQKKLDALIQTQLKDAHVHVQHGHLDLQRTNPQRKIEYHRQQLDECAERLQRQMDHRHRLHAEQVHGLSLQLHALSPLFTIERGYAIVHRQGQIITHINQVQPGDQLSVQVQDGALSVEVLPS